MPLIAEAAPRTSHVYAITPWKRKSDLLQVRSDLYRQGSDGDRRQRAADLVAAWAMRGNVPHAVLSTAQLIEAQLHLQAFHSTLFSIQSTYTIAFCRFVTGYCDNAMIGIARAPMHRIAQDLDMPASWIDMRHEATHGKLPGLKRLEHATQEALDWLWHHYWHDLEQQDDPERPRRNSTIPAKPEELRPFLTDFLKARIDEVKRKADPLQLHSASARGCLELIRFCRGDETCLRNLVRILVEPKMLVPADRAPGEPLDGAFMLWMPLLRALTRHQTLFLPLLLSRMTVILAEPNHLHAEPDTFREAVYSWLLHTLPTLRQNSMGYQHQPNDELKATVMEECILAPLTAWTAHLAKHVLENSQTLSFRERWQPYLADLTVPQFSEEKFVPRKGIGSNTE